MNISVELKVFAKDLTLLIVEDDRSLNEELVEISKMFFKNVEFAYNGREGLELYKNGSFDIVMSDITMPFLNGIDLSRKIKDIDEHQNIIILTAHSEVSYLVELVDIGIRQFIHKPFDDHELLYRLLKVAEEIVLSRAYKENPTELFSSKNENTLTVKNSKIIPRGLGHVPMTGKDFARTLEEDEVLWAAILDEIIILIELKEEFGYFVELIYTNKITKEVLHEISAVLRKMHTILSQIEAMKNMTLSLFELASFIETLDYSILSEKQMNQFKILEFIYDDISRFIDSTFIYKDSIDIHYLEDSLNSSIEQLKHNVLNIHLSEEALEIF